MQKFVSRRSGACAVDVPPEPASAQERDPGGLPEATGHAERAFSVPRLVLPAVAGAVLLAAAAWHCAMLFLTIAPPNSVTARHQKLINGYVYPEFGQYWQLFAPNPLQQEAEVQVRVRMRGVPEAAGEEGWVSLSDQDDTAIRHNPFPSHAQQNMLRRAWDFFLQSHRQDGTPNGENGELSALYLKRIALQRLGSQGCERRQAIQFRVIVTPVPPPGWSTEKFDAKPTRQVLPWWPVAESDCKGL